MIRRVLALALFTLLALPASASAHAALVRTAPGAAGTVTPAPGEVVLTYSEPIEPRFAAVSISDAGGHQVTAGSPRRREGDPATITVPLRRLDEGWYLVYWRVISADGHPVRGAYTFAVGPNPGPAPQFAVPSVSETAATPRLVAARWITILAAMLAVGLFVFRLLIARRGSNRPFAISAVIALIAAPVYLLLSTAQFSLRSAFDLSALTPLLDTSAFGRGYIRFELCLAMFVAAAAIAIAIDRPERARRSVAEILAIGGALMAALATLLVPGVSGHPSQTSPRGYAMVLDVVHLGAGAIWLGGLAGLLCSADRRGVVRRFSNVAIGAVLALLVTGTLAAILQLPSVASLWQTGYGQSLLVKIGLLLAALALAVVNLVRVRGGRSAPAGLVGGEAVAITGAVLAAAVLTSLAPPADAVADIGKPAARVGPGVIARTLSHGDYELTVNVTPNRAAVPNAFQVKLMRGKRPVTGAHVTAGFAMLDMEMGTQSYTLPETAQGTYGRQAPALVMVGHWGLTFDVEPPTGAPFTVTVVDRANG